MDPFEAALIAFLVLQIIFVTIRLFISAFMVKSLRWVDLACFITLLFSCGFSVIQIVIYEGSGLMPLAELASLHKAHLIIQLTISSEAIYILGTMFLKITLGLLMLSVMPQHKIKTIIYSLIAISIAFGLSYFFFFVFECPQDYWKHSSNAQCNSPDTVKGMTYTHGVLSATMDLCFAILTLFTPIYPADIPLRNKAFFAIVLLLACMGCIATFIRIAYIPELIQPTGNLIFTARRICLLSSIELSVGLICISLASFRPLLHFFLVHHKNRSPKNCNETISFSQGSTARCVIGRSENEIEDLENSRFSRWSSDTLKVGNDEWARG